MPHPNPKIAACLQIHHHKSSSIVSAYTPSHIIAHILEA